MPEPTWERRELSRAEAERVRLDRLANPKTTAKELIKTAARKAVGKR